MADEYVKLTVSGLNQQRVDAIKAALAAGDRIRSTIDSSISISELSGGALNIHLGGPASRVDAARIKSALDNRFNINLTITNVTVEQSKVKTAKDRRGSG